MNRTILKLEVASHGWKGVYTLKEDSLKKYDVTQAKPILKWAGGKTQMLDDLLLKVPPSYGRYIEPFFGGGALFLSLTAENGIFADSNPDLMYM